MGKDLLTVTSGFNNCYFWQLIETIQCCCLCPSIVFTETKGRFTSKLIYDSLFLSNPVSFSILSSFGGWDRDMDMDLSP
jgi:hypothetical protein